MTHLKPWSQFRRDGYIQFAGLVPHTLIKAAVGVIECDLRINYRPERFDEYNSRSYCPDIVEASPILHLFTKSPVHGLVDELLGMDNIVSGPGQIAIRKARNCDESIAPAAHLDGFAAPLNGVPPGTIYNHTLLAGVFLTPVQSEFAGNFTVWPGSHYTYEKYFRERGPRAMNEPMPRLAVGEPRQLFCGPGDVVLAHYSLGHSAAVNVGDIDRIAVFFRIALRALECDRWRYLTNIWEGWRISGV